MRKKRRKAGGTGGDASGSGVNWGRSDGEICMQIRMIYRQCDAA
jgi:hypothetical protein